MSTVTAEYSDGRSTRRHPVVLSTTTGRLRVQGASIDASYAMAEIRLTEQFEHAASMAYFSDGAHCTLRGDQRGALATLLGRRPSVVVRWQRHWPVALACVAGLAAVLAAGVIWGLPTAAERLTSALPASADVHVGAGSLAALTTQEMLLPTTLTPAQQSDIRQAWRRVLPAQSRVPLHLLIRAMPAQFGPNALALPGGTVIVNDAMANAILDGSARFDDSGLAAMSGVLAHEIGHVQGRHSMRALVRGSMTAAVTGFLFGDFSAVAAGAPAILLGAHHSRAMEEEADAYALATLQARHIPVTPMADLFDDIVAGQDDTDAAPGWFSTATGYLASHPGSKARAAAFRAVEQAAASE